MKYTEQYNHLRLLESEGGYIVTGLLILAAVVYLVWAVFFQKDGDKK